MPRRIPVDFKHPIGIREISNLYVIWAILANGSNLAGEIVEHDGTMRCEHDLEPALTSLFQQEVNKLPLCSWVQRGIDLVYEQQSTIPIIAQFPRKPLEREHGHEYLAEVVLAGRVCRRSIIGCFNASAAFSRLCDIEAAHRTDFRSTNAEYFAIPIDEPVAIVI